MIVKITCIDCNPDKPSEECPWVECPFKLFLEEIKRVLFGDGSYAERAKNIIEWSAAFLDAAMRTRDKLGEELARRATRN